MSKFWKKVYSNDPIFDIFLKGIQTKTVKYPTMISSWKKNMQCQSWIMHIQNVPYVTEAWRSTYPKKTANMTNFDFILQDLWWTIMSKRLFDHGIIKFHKSDQIKQILCMKLWIWPGSNSDILTICK